MTKIRSEFYTKSQSVALRNRHQKHTAQTTPSKKLLRWGHMSRAITHAFGFLFTFFSKCSAWLETYSVASPWRRARAIAGQENPGRGGPIAHRLRKGKRGAAPGRRNDSGLDGGYRGPDPWGNVPALSASLVSRVH